MKQLVAPLVVILLCSVGIVMGQAQEEPNAKGGTLHHIDIVGRFSGVTPGIPSGVTTGEYHSIMWQRGEFYRTGAMANLKTNNPNNQLIVYQNNFDMQGSCFETIRYGQSFAGCNHIGSTKNIYHHMDEAHFAHTQAGFRIAEYGSHWNSAKGQPPRTFGCVDDNICSVKCNVDTFGTVHRCAANRSITCAAPASSDPVCPDSTACYRFPTGRPCATIDLVCGNGTTVCTSDATCCPGGPGTCPDPNNAATDDYCRNFGTNDGTLDAERCNCRFLMDNSHPVFEEIYAEYYTDIINGRVEEPWTHITGVCTGAASGIAANDFTTLDTWRTDTGIRACNVTSTCSTAAGCQGNCLTGEVCTGRGGNEDGGYVRVDGIYQDNTGSTEVANTPGGTGAFQSRSGIWYGSFQHPASIITTDNAIAYRKDQLGTSLTAMQVFDPDTELIFNGCRSTDRDNIERGLDMAENATGCGQEDWGFWNGNNHLNNANSEGGWERGMEKTERLYSSQKWAFELCGQNAYNDPRASWPIGDQTHNQDPYNMEQYCAASMLMACYPDFMDHCAVSSWNGTSNAGFDETIGTGYCMIDSSGDAATDQNKEVAIPCTTQPDCPSGRTCRLTTTSTPPNELMKKFLTYSMNLGLPSTAKTCAGDSSDYCYLDSDCPGGTGPCVGSNWQFNGVGAAVRQYTKGFVALHPGGGGAKNITIPGTETYVDREGTVFTGGQVVSLKTGFGLVLACTTCVGGPECGDEVVDPGEECDDGDVNDCISSGNPYACCDGPSAGTGCNSNTIADSCRESCLDFKCGDQVVDTGEACDTTTCCVEEGDPSECTFEVVTTACPQGAANDCFDSDSVNKFECDGAGTCDTLEGDTCENILAETFPLCFTYACTEGGAPCSSAKDCGLGGCTDPLCVSSNIQITGVVSGGSFQPESPFQETLMMELSVADDRYALITVSGKVAPSEIVDPADPVAPCKATGVTYPAIAGTRISSTQVFDDSGFWQWSGVWQILLGDEASLPGGSVETATITFAGACPNVNIAMVQLANVDQTFPRVREVRAINTGGVTGISSMTNTAGTVRNGDLAIDFIINNDSKGLSTTNQGGQTIKLTQNSLAGTLHISEKPVTTASVDLGWDFATNRFRVSHFIFVLAETDTGIHEGILLESEIQQRGVAGSVNNQ